MVGKLLPAALVCCGAACATALVQHREPARTSSRLALTAPETAVQPVVQPAVQLQMAHQSALSAQAQAWPTPAQQAAPWPHGEDELSKAAATLFEQGLADPRGLEYREIEIAVGSPWNGGGQPLKTHGWILPALAQGARFAIAWSGLVYPVVSIGARASLRGDWEAQGTAKGHAAAMGGLGGSEASSVQFGVPEPLKAVLLLRLGEDKLARQIWKPAPQDQASPYLSLARDWAWNAFERAVTAHMRGDDQLALSDARLLTRAQPAIEAEAKRLGIEPEPDYSNSRFPDRKLPRLPFLSQLPALLDDCERRVANPQASPKVNPKSNPKASADIAALIDDLQNVDARQDGQPGGVSLAGDVRVQAIVKRGNQAVEPLLQALENDKRLTRSVSFHRDFFRSRHLIPVSEAAYAALVDLLRVGFKEYGEDGEPRSTKQLAAQIRAYWAKMGALSPIERFYTTLRDERAGKDQWLQAAANIVQPGDVESHGGWVTIPDRKPNQKIRLRGESLRDGRKPSVSQLLARRSDDIAAMRTGSTQDHFLYLDASQLALDLADWDKGEAIPLLKKRLARAWSIGAQPDDILAFNGSPVEHFGAMIVQMTLARVRCGDLSAYDEYAAWIQKADLKDASFAGRELLKPLAQGSARPSIARAIDALFNDARSPWANILAERNGFWMLDFWQTTLPLSQGFRKQAMRALADRSASGSITFNPRAQWNSRMEAQIEMKGMNMGFSGSKSDPDTPPAGQKRLFRVCDAAAYFYSQFRNGPKFQLFWPEKKRDAGVLACRKWLQAKK